jgi:hypothetical protein
MACPEGSPEAGVPRTGWSELLEGLQMGCYHNKLVAAAIDSPLTLTGMPHGDAMDILKELDVLPGHRHLLMQACVKATEPSELLV